MVLSERSLTWLRALDAIIGTPDGCGDVAASSFALGVMTQRTPAWTEHYLAILDQLAERDTGPTDHGLELEPCPQVVGVDFPSMALRRAEWVNGNLLMTLAPSVEIPLVFTSFRLVGAEPRNWDVHGIEGCTLELTTNGLNIRVPMVGGDLELIRGSY